MRDNPVPCAHATLYEMRRGEHVTWEDDCICKPCKRNIGRFIQRGLQINPELAELESEVDVRIPAEVHPSHPSQQSGDRD